MYIFLEVQIWFLNCAVQKYGHQYKNMLLVPIFKLTYCH